MVLLLHENNISVTTSDEFPLSFEPSSYKVMFNPHADIYPYSNNE